MIGRWDSILGHMGFLREKEGQERADKKERRRESIRRDHHWDQ